MANSFPSSGGKRGNYYRRNNNPFANIRRNHRIRVPEVRLISPEGKQLGVLATSKAISLSLEVGLDLVEVAPNARPPVCRIMDFGKYVYEESKKTSNAKATASKIKEIEFTPRIEENDFYTKLRRAEEFLSHGSKVKLRLKFRGREMARTEIGYQVMKRAIGELETMGTADAEPKLVGRNINVMLTALPANKRKLKFHTEEEVAKTAPPQDDAPKATSDKAEAGKTTAPAQDS